MLQLFFFSFHTPYLRTNKQIGFGKMSLFVVSPALGIAVIVQFQRPFSRNFQGDHIGGVHPVMPATRNQGFRSGPFYNIARPYEECHPHYCGNHKRALFNLKPCWTVEQFWKRCRIHGIHTTKNPVHVKCVWVWG